MTAPVVTMSPTGGPDAEDLRRIGYRQELHRRLGWFSSFAAGFSFVSILTTVFQLFALGYSFGGPAFFWTWPLVFAGQLCVALVFAELAASWPLAGCIYQWSRRLAGEIVGWFAGWAMMIGYVVSVAAIGIALQAVLPAVWSGFQIIGSDPSVTSASGAANGILLGSGAHRGRHRDQRCRGAVHGGDQRDRGELRDHRCGTAAGAAIRPCRTRPWYRHPNSQRLR
jgi:hypothetical protein